MMRPSVKPLSGLAAASRLLRAQVAQMSNSMGLLPSVELTDYGAKLDNISMRYVLVRVLDCSGKGVARAKVTVWQSGWIGGQLAAKETNRDGAAEFALDLKDADRIDIHVNGTAKLSNSKPEAEFRIVY
jgi:hypothetical protein